jgi:hypothetical protein
MAIKGNIGQATLDIGAVSIDTAVINFANRVAITAASLHNTTASNRAVTLYASPDTTSASGKKIADYTLAANRSEDISEIIGQGYEGENVIAVASTGGAVAGDLNIKVTYIQYTGDS